MIYFGLRLAAVGHLVAAAVAVCLDQYGVCGGCVATVLWQQRRAADAGY